MSMIHTMIHIKSIKAHDSRSKMFGVSQGRALPKIRGGGHFGPDGYLRHPEKKQTGSGAEPQTASKILQY